MVTNKLFISIFYSSKWVYEHCIKDLIKEFGEVKKESFEYDFDVFTDYYEKEMGKGLRKKMIIFRKKIEEEDLAEIKQFIDQLEAEYSVDGKRKINIDPGFVSDRVVLASCKGKDFKKDIGNGYFVHEVLRLEDGKVKEYWHTFRDYKNKEIQEFFFNFD